MRFGSLFSGVGGLDMGLEAAGMECTWQVEIDARCRSVLARHWPDVKRYEDVSHVGVVPLAGRADDGRDGRGSEPDVDGREGTRHLLEPVELICGGFPCQDLSVAGKRAGLEGGRSGLWWEFHRIIREMRSATGNEFPRWAVIENVPGLFSSNGGADFGILLDSLADLGAVVVEWGVLDAQHFGVPQRRRRVFILAGFDPREGCADPLLPVRESGEWDLEKSGEAWEDTAARAGGSVAATLNSGGNSGGFRTESGEHLIPVARAYVQWLP